MTLDLLPFFHHAFQVLGFPLRRDVRHRLATLMLGITLATGRRTVTSWIRAAEVQEEYQEYYTFLVTVGRERQSLSTALWSTVREHLSPGRLHFVIDDTPTKRAGPQVQGAGKHHNPTPGPADGPFLWGHSWVTCSVVHHHPEWGVVALPLAAELYVRQTDLETIPEEYGWEFQTKLVLGNRLARHFLDQLSEEEQAILKRASRRYRQRRDRPD